MINGRMRNIEKCENEIESEKLKNERETDKWKNERETVIS